MTTPIRVLVTNAGEDPAINFCRSLRQAKQPYYIIGTESVPYRFSNAEVDEIHPTLWGDDPRYMPLLESIIRETRPDVVYASDTNEELLKISLHRERIMELGSRVLMPAHHRIEIFEDKWRSYELLAEAGVRAPATMLVKDENSLDTAFARFGKVWLRDVYGSGGRSSLPTDDRTLAEAWVRRHNGWGRFTVAEVLTGRSATWSALWNHGQLVACQIRERLFWEFSSLAPSGVTGITGAQSASDNRDIHETAIAAVRATDPRPHGIISVDMTHGADGLPYVTEIQASRFYSSILFLAQAGLNFPDLFVKVAMDRLPADFKPLINPVDRDLIWIKNVDCLPRMIRRNDVKVLESLLASRLETIRTPERVHADHELTKMKA